MTDPHSRARALAEALGAEAFPVPGAARNAWIEAATARIGVALGAAAGQDACLHCALVETVNRAGLPRFTEVLSALGEVAAEVLAGLDGEADRAGWLTALRDGIADAIPRKRARRHHPKIHSGRMQ